MSYITVTVIIQWNKCSKIPDDLSILSVPFFFFYILSWTFFFYILLSSFIFCLLECCSPGLLLGSLVILRAPLYFILILDLCLLDPIRSYEFLFLVLLSSKLIHQWQSKFLGFPSQKMSLLLIVWSLLSNFPCKF